MIEYGLLEMPWWVGLIALVIGVVGAARLTRILTHDDYPPAIAIRIWWYKITDDGPWAKLVSCPWCAGPWIFAITLGSFVVSFLHPALGWAWWIFWGWLAGSYWVSQYVYFDEGNGD